MGGSPVWEVDRSGLLVQKMKNGDWKMEFLVRATGSQPNLEGYSKRYQELKDYAKRHALAEACFPSRARAVDAVRMALADEPLDLRPLTRITWRQEEEGVYRSNNGHWRLKNVAGRSLISPLSREASEQVAANPGIKRMLSRDQIWTLERNGEWLERIEVYLANQKEKAKLGSGPS